MSLHWLAISGHAALLFIAGFTPYRPWLLVLLMLSALSRFSLHFDVFALAGHFWSSNPSFYCRIHSISTLTACASPEDTAQHSTGDLCSVALSFLGRQDNRVLNLSSSDPKFRRLEKSLTDVRICIPSSNGKRTKNLRGLIEQSHETFQQRARPRPIRNAVKRWGDISYGVKKTQCLRFMKFMAAKNQYWNNVALEDKGPSGSSSLSRLSPPSHSMWAGLQFLERICSASSRSSSLSVEIVNPTTWALQATPCHQSCRCSGPQVITSYVVRKRAYI